MTARFPEPDRNFDASADVEADDPITFSLGNAQRILTALRMLADHYIGNDDTGMAHNCLCAASEVVSLRRRSDRW